MRTLTFALLVAVLASAACTSGGLFNGAAEQTAPAEVISGFAVAPNPASGQATVNYALHRDVSRVRLKIYNAAGDFVRGYDDLPARATAGVVVARTWDLADFEGRAVPSGAYLAKLVVEAGETSWKLTQTVVVP